MIIYSQRDPLYANHPLGWGPALGKIGPYGCLNTCFAIIAKDCGFDYNPATIDELFTAKQIFVREPTGTYDLLPDNALDLAFPGRFQTNAYGGFRSDLIAQALPTPDTYIILWISTGAVPTHFVIGYNAAGTQIADPWTGAVGSLAGYGGPGAVHKTLTIKSLPAPVVVVTPAPPVAVPPVIPAIVLPPNPNPSLRYPNALWIGSPNFTADRRDAADPPTQPSYDLKKSGYDFVFHSTDGAAAGVDATFVNPNPGGSGPRSAHVMFLKNGLVHQYVDLKDTAWHAGKFVENTRSVGMEFEDGGDNQAPRTPEQLAEGAKFVKWVEEQLGPAKEYLRHKDVVPTQCPGNVPVEDIVKAAHAPAVVVVPKPLPPEPTPVPSAPVAVPADVSLQGLLILLINIFRKLMAR